MSKTHLIIPEGYTVKQDGVVASTDREQTVLNRWGTETTRKLKGRELKQWSSGAGYLQVSCGGGFKRDVHRLVAETYIPNPLGLPCVNHKDGNKRNNHVDNLEWVDHSGNMQHAAGLGLVKGFYGDQKLIPSKELDKEIEEAYLRFGSAKAMARSGFRNCDRTTISRYIQKRNLTIKQKVNQYAHQ